MMTLECFRESLGQKGSDLSRWPWLSRRSAQCLLARSAEARELLADARSLDESVSEALRPDPISATLLARLHHIPAAHPRPERRGHPASLHRFLWYLAPATALASMAAGFYVGVALPAADPGGVQMVDLASLVYGTVPVLGLL